MRSCAHWLNWKCGIALGAAREKVRVARALEDLPRIREAFRRGELSYSKVRAMTRIGTPDNEEYLLMIAHHGTAAHVEQAVRAYRHVDRLQARTDANTAHAMRSCEWHYDEDGMLVLKARLPAEAGAAIVEALAAAASDLQADESAATPPRSDQNDRVATGDYPPVAPTDPDVRNSRIRFLRLRLRCRAIHTVYHTRWGQWITGEQASKPRPRHASGVRAPSKPVAPTALDLAPEPR